MDEDTIHFYDQTIQDYIGTMHSFTLNDVRWHFVHISIHVGTGDTSLNVDGQIRMFNLLALVRDFPDRLASFHS